MQCPNCTTIKTKSQSNLGLSPKDFKMSYLIQYLSYVHTAFGFQLLLTRSVLNSWEIKTIPNFKFHKNLTSKILTSYSNTFYKQVFQNDWHVVLYQPTKFRKQTININKVIKNLTKNPILDETLGEVVWPLRGIDFAHFGLHSVMVYEGTTVVYQRACRFNSI